jgi:uncharacterized protein YbjT (DUF2867 family)
MRQALSGIDVLFNTYWVRFAHGNVTYEGAVENSRALVRAAVDAGVQRIVHVSITNPSIDSSLPYFRGKAEVEEIIRQSGLSFAILRPAVFFGGRDVLINNIAFLLRRLPVFGVVSGDYGIQPIHVEDMAHLMVAQRDKRENTTLDAVGPEIMSFKQLVSTVATAVGSRARIVRVPKALLLASARIVGRLIGDVVLTRDEIEGLSANLLVTAGVPTGTTKFSIWLTSNADGMGRKWASELARHFVA